MDPQPTVQSVAEQKGSPYVGQVVYFYAFDVAYDTLRHPLKTLLGQPVEQVAIDLHKRSPRQLFFYRAQMVTLPPVEWDIRGRKVSVERTVKILPVGAISIMVRLPFTVERVRDLVGYHDLEFDSTSLDAEVKKLAEQVRQELKPYLIKPSESIGDEEAYTVFCIESAARGEEHFSTEEWLEQNRREVAALLTQEPDVGHLSDQESEESTSLYLSYYDHDIVVMDWDAALVVDEPKQFGEVLYVMELANVQLAELEAYDKLLDDVVERSYRDMGERGRGHSRRATMRQLSEIRIDLARLSDELSNITKFFGDWHLARVYHGISNRFHLTDWHRTIDEKLKTLDDLYQLLKSDQNNRWMLFLEVMIVLLFIIDLAGIFIFKK